MREPNFTFAYIKPVFHSLAMQSTDQPPNSRELPPKARRAVRMIYIAMAVMILLPFILIWLTGSLRF